MQPINYFLNVVKKQGKTTQISSKRLQEDMEHLTPEIVVNNSSLSAIIEKEDITMEPQYRWTSNKTE